MIGPIPAESIHTPKLRFVAVRSQPPRSVGFRLPPAVDRTPDIPVWPRAKPDSWTIRRQAS
jgi:hypothetical protein